MTSRSQTPPFDARQMLAYSVHLQNIGAALQQCAVDLLLVRQSQAFSGQGQQRRSTAGNQANDQILSGETLAQSHHSLRGLESRNIWNGMRSFQHLDALLQASGPGWRVVVTGDHHTRQGSIGWPQGLKCMGHGACGLACAQDQSVPTRYSRQTMGHVQERLGTRHRCVKKLAQKPCGVL